MLHLGFSITINLLIFRTHTQHVEDLHIASPETPRQRGLLNNLDSVFVKAEDINLPRLRRPSQGRDSLKQAARHNLQKSRLDRRKQTFSSDEDEDDGAISTANAYDSFAESAVATPEYYPDVDAEEDQEYDPSSKPEDESTVKKEESTEPPAKRRRGRPRKSEAEKKEKVVTRRSRRIVENPTLRKHHILEQPALMLVPKPLRAIGLIPGASTPATRTAGALLLTQKPNGKQKPLVIDAERFHTASSRDKRFNLTTLDVLGKFIEEHNPRATKNDIINEQVVLDEFKAHLLYYVRHLMDLHASIRDISHDIAEVQRRKNETRRNILELKKKHADVATDLSKVRKEYTDDKQGHAEFMAMVGEFTSLKAAVTSPSVPSTNLSNKVSMDLDNYARIADPRGGVAVQLRAINGELAAMVDNHTASS